MQIADKGSGPRRPRRRVLAVGLALVVLVAVAVPLAWATDVFSDVPTSSPHHDDINTIARVGITGGCAPGLYCPTTAVRRDQMASFIARALRASTPVFRTATTGAGAVDIDASPVMCQTGTFTPTVAARARMDSWISLEAAASAQMSFFVRNVFSTNGGTTWQNPDAIAVSRSDAHLTGAWGHANNSAIVSLTPGSTYIFAVQTGRIGGTTDASDSRCEVIAEITYNDAGASNIGSAPVVTENAPATPDGN